MLGQQRVTYITQDKAYAMTHNLHEAEIDEKTQFAWARPRVKLTRVGHTLSRASKQSH